MGSSRFLFINGVASDAPLISSFLETHPGAYTTSRTQINSSCVLFWDKHLRRLSDSARILYNSHPELLFKVGKPNTLLFADISFWESTIRSLVNDCMNKALEEVLNEKRICEEEEWAITALVSGNAEKSQGSDNSGAEGIARVLDVFVHVGPYVPPVFGVQESAARVAVVGRGRYVAAAKYSNWVTLRRPLEKLRPPLATELLLSNDGDQILEGCLTNFFVVCRMDNNEATKKHWHDCRSAGKFEVQTAPLRDGVLPGVIRQVVIDVCLNKGIPFREVAPSWSKSETWDEAFLTNSLRLVQHVETIQIPSYWESLEAQTWREVSWEFKRFKEGPGMLTTIIQEEIMKRATSEGFPLNKFV